MDGKSRLILALGIICVVLGAVCVSLFLRLRRENTRQEKKSLEAQKPAEQKPEAQRPAEQKPEMQRPEARKPEESGEKPRHERDERELTDQIIFALSNAVEAKDIYTNGHSRRVAEYSMKIVQRMGWDKEQQRRVYYAGILHDVGKIRIPDTIINKAGRLTDEEYQQIQLHTTAGYHVLRGISAISDFAVGARWHHERYDGRGYPNGLKGDNIPLIARIISVADSYDAMTSNRSYREVMPQARVRGEIERGLGTQFDPQIGKIMLELIDEDVEYRMRQMEGLVKPHILMIDDDPVFLRLTELTMKDEPFHMEFANNADEGIARLQQSSFDLLLLDVEMVGRNGFDVLRWLRQERNDIKVILLTGNRDMNTILLGEDLRVQDYMTKPIQPIILKESIQSVLRH